MAKRKFIITERERKALLHFYESCRHAATRTRYQAVRLYGTGYPVSEIVEITGCSRNSLMDWCHSYRKDSSQGLVDKRQGGTRAKLTKLQIEELQGILHQYTPKERMGVKSSTAHGSFWNVKDLAKLLQEKYGVIYKSASSYRELLHLCGFSYQKTEKVFKNHSQMKVADFEEVLEKKCST